MKLQAKLFISIIFLYSCSTEIKNSNTDIKIEQGTNLETTANQTDIKPEESKESEILVQNDFIGYWVGYFNKADQNIDNNIYADETSWTRENKINISIDEILDSIVIGHSVVAGNDRPFKGIMTDKDGYHSFKLKEPGDHKYDGEFLFTIKNSELSGTWTAYKDIEIKKRNYTLEKKSFKYNPNIKLERAKRYVEWNNYVTDETLTEEVEWITQNFATATDLIYSINASNTLLTKSDVENLKKGDLVIIRNTIYARHGYSFKNRPLRVFFDAQSWYIPVHTNIKNDFTDIEKQNIQLLLKYEKNATEYYDYFGRG